MSEESGEIASLEAELRHATAIAACSIGQPDRAANIAYRELVRKKLRTARELASKPCDGTCRYVAPALRSHIHPEDAPCERHND